MSTISVADVYTQNQPCLIIPKSKSFPELIFDSKAIRRNINGIGHQQLSLGVTSKDVVSLCLPNSHAIVFAFLGVQSIGAAANPLNPAYTVDEIVFYLQDTKCKLLIIPENTPATAAVIEASKLTNTKIAYVETVYLAGNITTRLTNPIMTTTSCLPPVSVECTGLILHTSGTTNRPKAVPLSLKNLNASCQNIIQTYEFSRKDKGLVLMPLFHVHGLMCALLAPLMAGSTVIIQAPKFSARECLPLLARYNITWFTAVPTMHQILLSRIHGMDDDKRTSYLHGIRANLRFLRSCSSALSPTTYQDMVQTWGVPVYEAYAMTEASHQMTSNPMVPRAQKPGSVGVAHGCVTVCILDADGNPVGTDVEGEICVKGENVTNGYLNNPKANEETFINGFLRTGDTGTMDSEGYVYIKGRSKEQINRGGEKIMPGEVDNALLSHPAVAEAVAYAAPDQLFGQVVHAAVRVKPDVVTNDIPEQVESIQKHAGQILSKFKVPVVIHVTDNIPKTATGKIQRRLVAGHFAKLTTAKL